MGMMCQPADVCVWTHDAVRFGWSHAALMPLMYTPTARKGEADHADICEEEGAAQGSKPSPVYVPGCAATAAAAGVASWPDSAVPGVVAVAFASSSRRALSRMPCTVAS